ncbi:cysteine and histidine-rich domain-containing protein morgana-like isoform X2 [Metopolophium dirhodum]|uniref:cysteine and histidine-rich domain-containing protein morgana-like isoform X2 n=1 Tax=Metopolophium dirhodum TaxID=44670 RepID=UPI00298F4A02|nr:cysteine and histidine-rich domain-containing protein morgana-like isoform X2 [Metopolophium dirhodum]
MCDGTNLILCYNHGCAEQFDQANNTEGYEGAEIISCDHHPSTLIFHEGMKYWSRCKKKMSDFHAFSEQIGCFQRKHCWINDWHQSGPWVVISIFAKKYDPNNSFVKLSPVKLSVELYSPFDNYVFSKNMELYGIVDVNASCVSMLPIKVEIKLKKQKQCHGVYWNIESVNFKMLQNKLLIQNK